MKTNVLSSLPVSFLLWLALGAVVPRTSAQAGPPGEAWSSSDVGAVGMAGSVQGNHPQYTVRGSGADIWGAADAFQFYHVRLEGDGAVIVRVASFSNTHDWAKAGLMVREDLSPGARNVFAYVTPRNHAGLQMRATTGGATTQAGDVSATMPQWLKLVRSGNTFNAFRSANGMDWVLLGTTVCELPAIVRMGYAVCSHHNAMLATAVFDQTAFTAPDPADAPPPAPTGLHSSGVTASSVSLRWEGDATQATAYAVERRAGSAEDAFTEVGSTLAHQPYFTDSGLAPNTAYSYRVRARNGALYSGYSNTYLVSTLDGAPAGEWTGADIGYVGLPGSQTVAGGTITVNAGGNDIWGPADGFRFVYRTLRGDGEILARVTRLDETDPWAKAGVMIRESLAPGARNVMTFLTPARPGGMQARETTDGTTTFSGMYGPRPPTWVRLVRRGDQITSSFGPDPSTGYPAGQVTLPMGAEVLIGVAVSAHTPNARTTAVFEDTQVLGGPPPPAWTVTRWNGAVGSFAETGYQTNQFDLLSDGADIWGVADDGIFGWQRRSGDVEVVAVVDRLTNTHPWAKAGVMFRASDSPDAANVFVCLTRSNGASFQYRGSAGAVTVEVGRAAGVRPWAALILRRRGDTFEAYCDTGATRISLGAVSLAMPAEIQIGVAGSSHAPGTAMAAYIYSLSIR